MTEYAPIAIRDLMISETAPAGLAVLLGAGAAMRVYPVDAAQDADYPNVVYHGLDEVTQGNKDVTTVVGWDLMVQVNCDGPTGYITTQKIARLVRQAIDRKTIQVELDDSEEGETATLQLRYTGREDLDLEPEKKIHITALTFRAIKIQ